MKTESKKTATSGENIAGTETDRAEELRKLTEQNKRLKIQVRRLKKAEKAKKKVEFSKLIFLGTSVATVAITVFSCRIIWLTMDTSALAYLIPAVFAEMAAATGFYYTKAKAENKIKLMAQYDVKPEPSNFND